jgi:hypothetical protein
MKEHAMKMGDIEKPVLGFWEKYLLKELETGVVKGFSPEYNPLPEYFIVS